MRRDANKKHFTVPGNPPRARVFLSHCQPHHKHESRQSCERLRCMVYPTALLAAFGSAYHNRPKGRASEIRSTPDRKSTRLNSSHSQISYAVFCLKKKKISLYYDSRARITSNICSSYTFYINFF